MSLVDTKLESERKLMNSEVFLTTTFHLVVEPMTLLRYEWDANITLQHDNTNLVVTSYDDNSDSCFTAPCDRVLNLLSGRIEHANDTHESHVRL